jgi:hypothetical protein
VLTRFWVVCVLTLAPAIAWAQPASAPTPAMVTATDQGLATVSAGLRRVSQLTASRTKLTQQYQDQLGAIDRLKNERASWRRDRELRASMADASTTGNQLQKLNEDLATANASLAPARRALAVAIDVELKAGATGARGGQLARLRAELDTALNTRPKKIILPAEKVDPNADPEDLDEQLQIIRDTEKQLANEVAGLDQQAAELARVADLRHSHDRANDLMIRDDDQPHRDVHTTSTHLDGASAPTSNSAVGAGTGTGTGDFNEHGSSFETEATFVLGEVIDPSTIDTLARASRSGDPAKRAAAARATRDAVAARLEKLHRQRAQIEQIERQRRGK